MAASGSVERALRSPSIDDIEVGADGTIASLSRGVIRRRDPNGHVLRIPAEGTIPGTAATMDIEVDGHGVIWVASTEGLFIGTDEGLHTLTAPMVPAARGPLGEVCILGSGRSSPRTIYVASNQPGRRRDCRDAAPHARPRRCTASRCQHGFGLVACGCEMSASWRAVQVTRPAGRRRAVWPGAVWVVGPPALTGAGISLVPGLPVLGRC